MDWLFSFLDKRRPSDKFIIYILLMVCMGSALYTLSALNQKYVTTVPDSGGTLVEGVIGTPRFVNPVLAITRADHDLVALTYSGLMRLGTDGNLQNDLAESITVSDDGLVYNVILKNNVVFHDDTPLKAEDVEFTINLIQDPELKSPLRGNWSGVSMEVLGEYEINFILEDAYAPFLENLTVGILPKHIWSDLSTEELPFSQHNTEPIGSGPYQLSDIKRNAAGLVNEYLLEAYTKTEKVPNISSVVVRFYQNEADLAEALKKQEITSTAALSEETLGSLGELPVQIIEQPLPRVFAVYFNQNRSPALRDPAVRKALSTLVDRTELIEKSVAGYGTPTSGPMPPSFSDVESSSALSTTSTTTLLTQAQEILFAADWTQTEAGTWEKEIDEVNTTLSVTIRTTNAPVFAQIASYLETTWRELGVEVGVELFEQSDLVQAVIRPRDYQALLFGSEIGRVLDFYPFWHSSEREDPGLNIALYTNITADKLLEEIRTTTDPAKQTELLTQFRDEITAETPAIFLFSPSFIYVLNSEIAVAPLTKIARPSERFLNISDWYMSESTVWPLFAD